MHSKFHILLKYDIKRKYTKDKIKFSHLVDRQEYIKEVYINQELKKLLDKS